MDKFEYFVMDGRAQYDLERAAVFEALGQKEPSEKSLQRDWGADGHSWVGRSLKLVGDPSVRFGGVAVGGIKISAMSDVEDDFSMMLSVSRGKRQEHRVKKLEVAKKITDPQAILTWFSDNAIKADIASLDTTYDRAKLALSSHPEHEKKLNEVYETRKKELAGE